MAVVAKERIRHNDKIYEPGEVIEQLTKKDEERLIHINSAVPAPSNKQTEKEMAKRKKKGSGE